MSIDGSYAARSSRADAATTVTRVLVVGATGRVGAVVVHELSKDPSLAVISGSRHPSRTGSADDRVSVALDVADQGSVRRVLRSERPDVVVLCVEPPTDAFHAACFEAGVSVVDVTASARRHASVEALAASAREHGASAVLSVGVAPGLTNSLAQRVDAALGGTDHVDLTVLLGAGETHGPEALTWTIDALVAPDTSAARRQRVALPGYGTRTTYPMPFSDQVTLQRTLGIPAVITRMSLDSRLVSLLLFRAGRTRVGRRVLGSGLGRSALLRASGRLPLGTDEFLVLARGRAGGRTASRWIRGRGQSRTTGIVAALAAQQVAAGLVPAGVWHVEQLPGLLDAIDSLRDQGFTFGASDSDDASASDGDDDSIGVGLAR